jgi:hypothetical protein
MKTRKSDEEWGQEKWSFCKNDKYIIFSVPPPVIITTRYSKE